MTDDEIIKAVAELDGWKQETTYKFWIKRNVAGEEIGSHLPSYLTSRDAVVPVIEKQHLQVKVDANTLLECKMDVWPAFLASPRQLCEALLRAVGKWNDE